MAPRKLKILATGRYLPERRVSGVELDRMIGVEEGLTATKTGVQERRYVTDETVSVMGARAAREALERAGLGLDAMDAVICASAVPEQLIPCTAVLIQKALGGSQGSTPCFDINATCLSFVTALDLVSTLIDARRFRRVLLVSTEISSVGLNHREWESTALFGDGAAAAVVAHSDDGGEGTPESCVELSRMETWTEGSDYCEIKGGGSGLHATKLDAGNRDQYLFRMDGKRVFKTASTYLPPFMERFFADSGLTMRDVDLVVPHQASLPAMALIQRKLEIPPERWMTILSDHGNCVAASIPLALNQAIVEGRLRRGQRALLLGTGAGLTIGAVLLRY
jgi:3-oxoacyl-[acyl-carrier-protein] synthase-3